MLGSPGTAASRSEAVYLAPGQESCLPWSGQGNLSLIPTPNLYTLEEREAHTCLQRYRIHLGEVIQQVQRGLLAQELLQVFSEGFPTMGIRA